MPWVVGQPPVRPFLDRSPADTHVRNRARTCRNTRRDGPLFPAFSISQLNSIQSGESTDAAPAFGVDDPAIDPMWLWFRSSRCGFAVRMMPTSEPKPH